MLPMQLAVCRFDFNAVEMLHLAGAEVQVRHSDGLTLAHIAAKANSVPILEYLRLQGVGMEEADRKGGSPLHWAAH
jgi:hypothetical protein